MSDIHFITANIRCGSPIILFSFSYEIVNAATEVALIECSFPVFLKFRK